MTDQMVTIRKKAWEFVSTNSHWLGGYAVVVTPSALFHSEKGMWIVAGILTVVAAFKEFYLDAQPWFESLDESGGMPGHIKDFSGYLAGIALAVLAYYGTQWAR